MSDRQVYLEKWLSESPSAKEGYLRNVEVRTAFDCAAAALEERDALRAGLKALIDAVERDVEIRDTGASWLVQAALKIAKRVLEEMK